MPRVIDARPDHVEAVYRESFALWGGGLSYEGYHALWADLRATPWARDHLRFRVLVGNDDEVLSSLKHYRPRFKVDGGTVAGSVIGAVFTPAAARGRGHAGRLIEDVLAQAAEDGDRYALLFSDVGTRFYLRFGFVEVPCSDALGRIPTRPADGSSDRGRVVPMAREHARAVAAARDRGTDRWRLSVDRDDGLWAFVRARSRGFFERYPDGHVRQRCSVALRDGRFAGYVVALEGRGEWSVREVGARDGTAEGEAAMLRIAGADAARRGLRRAHGWLPEDVTACLDGWRWIHAPRRRAVPMLAPLSAGSRVDDLATSGAVHLTFLDQF